MKQYTVVFITSKINFYKELKDQLERGNILVKRLRTFQVDPAFFKSDQPHMIVLICNSKEINELNTYRCIKDNFRGLVIVINEPENRGFQLLALDLGADASMTVRDGIPLIAASMKALLRRFIPEESMTHLHFGELTIDRRKRDAFILNKPVYLSTIEFTLLWALARQAGCVVSREEIHKDIYHEMYNGYDRNIDLYISRIRQKIGDDPYFPRYLKTVRGVGYQFVESE